MMHTPAHKNVEHPAAQFVPMDDELPERDPFKNPVYPYQWDWQGEADPYRDDMDEVRSIYAHAWAERKES